MGGGWQLQCGHGPWRLSGTGHVGYVYSRREDVAMGEEDVAGTKYGVDVGEGAIVSCEAEEVLAEAVHGAHDGEGCLHTECAVAA